MPRPGAGGRWGGDGGSRRAPARGRLRRAGLVPAAAGGGGGRRQQRRQGRRGLEHGGSPRGRCLGHVRHRWKGAVCLLLVFWGHVCMCVCVCDYCVFPPRDPQPDRPPLLSFSLFLCPLPPSLPPTHLPRRKCGPRTPWMASVPPSPPAASCPRTSASSSAGTPPRPTPWPWRRPTP